MIRKDFKGKELCRICVIWKWNSQWYLSSRPIFWKYSRVLGEMSKEIDSFQFNIFLIFPWFKSSPLLVITGNSPLSKSYFLILWLLNPSSNLLIILLLILLNDREDQSCSKTSNIDDRAPNDTKNIKSTFYYHFWRASPLLWLLPLSSELDS